MFFALLGVNDMVSLVLLVETTFDEWLEHPTLLVDAVKERADMAALDGGVSSELRRLRDGGHNLTFAVTDGLQATSEVASALIRAPPCNWLRWVPPGSKADLCSRPGPVGGLLRNGRDQPEGRDPVARAGVRSRCGGPFAWVPADLGYWARGARRSSIWRALPSARVPRRPPGERRRAQRRSGLAGKGKGREISLPATFNV
jgi:hypothetical protein